MGGLFSLKKEKEVGEKKKEKKPTFVINLGGGQKNEEEEGSPDIMDRIERIEGKVEAFRGMAYSQDDRISELSERIGEIRSMVLELGKSPPKGKKGKAGKTVSGLMKKELEKIRNEMESKIENELSLLRKQVAKKAITKDVPVPPRKRAQNELIAESITGELNRLSEDFEKMKRFAFVLEKKVDERIPPGKKLPVPVTDSSVKSLVESMDVLSGELDHVKKETGALDRRVTGLERDSGSETGRIHGKLDMVHKRLKAIEDRDINKELEEIEESVSRVPAERPAVNAGPRPEYHYSPAKRKPLDVVDREIEGINSEKKELEGIIKEAYDELNNADLELAKALYERVMGMYRHLKGKISEDEANDFYSRIDELSRRINSVRI